MAKESDIKGTSNKRLVPELRFPKFEKEGEWKKMKLGEISNIINEKCKVKDLKIETYISTENILKDYAGITQIAKLPQTGSFTLFSKGDILVANIRPYLKKIWIADFDGAASNDVIVFRSNENMNNSYVSHLIKNDEFVNYCMAGAKGVKMPRGDKEMMINYSVPTPSSIDEQQKIAECLSSIDEEISAMKEKVEHLKIHKKGLMQKLFPAAGKFVPELRFPEFEKDGEWEEKKLGECLLQSPDYGLNAPAVPFSPKLPTYLRITDISDDGKFIKEGKVSVNAVLTEANSLQDGDIVFARTGASVGKTYKYRKGDGQLVFAGFLIRIKPNTLKYNSEFIFQYLLTDTYKKWVSIISVRSGQPGINSNEYSSLSIPFPSLAEQQKIAECLSSIDELISLYENKVILLELHKKGLMQQLFPKLQNHNN